MSEEVTKVTIQIILHGKETNVDDVIDSILDIDGVDVVVMVEPKA